MKFLIVIGGVVLAAIIAAYLLVGQSLGTVVVKGVNSYGPKITQTKVVLDSASLSPLSGTGTLSGLTVGNPPGWSDNPAFHLGKVHLDVVPRSVFGDTIVINEIVIDQPEFNYETKIISSNIKDLLKNIEEFTGKNDKPDQKVEKPKKFIVKKFRLTNGKATLGMGPTALPVPLPAISLDNLGVAENGITADQLAATVMRDVLGSIVAATANALGQVGSTTGSLSVEKTKEAAKQVGDSIKKLFEKKP